MVPLHGMSKVHRTHGPFIMILIQVSIRTANPSSALCSMWRTQMMKVTALLTVRAQIRIQICLTQRIARMDSKMYRCRFQHLILQQRFEWKDQGIRNPRAAETLTWHLHPQHIVPKNQHLGQLPSQLTSQLQSQLPRQLHSQLPSQLPYQLLHQFHFPRRLRPRKAKQ